VHVQVTVVISIFERFSVDGENTESMAMRGQGACCHRKASFHIVKTCGLNLSLEFVDAEAGNSGAKNQPQEKKEGKARITYIKSFCSN